MTSTLKRCSRCKEEKELEHFHKNRTTKSGYSFWCVSCRLEYRRANYTNNREYQLVKNRKWRERNPSYMKEYRLKNKELLKHKKIEYYGHNKSKVYLRNIRNKYGVSEEDLILLIESQKNSCAICTTTFSSDFKYHIDHNHSTGVVRGLLCRTCNHLLGNAKDTISILENAASYLRINL